jgi:hypothetical protein
LVFAAVTETTWVTSGAALKLESPAWSAASVQDPIETPVTVEPETVQTDVVSELKVTCKPDVAVADKVAVPPIDRVDINAKVID